MMITIFVSDVNKVNIVFEKLRISKMEMPGLCKYRDRIEITSEHRDLIRICVPNDNCRGMRHNYVFIDKDVNEEHINHIILPKILPIFTAFGHLNLERDHEFINVDTWNGEFYRKFK